MAILRQSLFGKDELEALKAPPGKGLAPATPRRVRRLCLESQGFNNHAATCVHECARDRQARTARILGAPKGRARQCRTRPLATGKPDRREYMERQWVGRGSSRYWLKNEWKGDKNAVVMTRRDLALRIMAQIPLPKRANTHYHGIWAPGAKDRDLVVPALGQGPGCNVQWIAGAWQERSEQERTVLCLVVQD